MSNVKITRRQRTNRKPVIQGRRKPQTTIAPTYMPEDLPPSVRATLKALYPNSNYWRHE